MAHGFRQVTDLGGKLHRQTGIVKLATAKISNSLRVITQDMLTLIPLSLREYLEQMGIVTLVITLNHCLTKGFFRAEMVIERPFRHLSLFKQFGESHAVKTQT